MSGLSARLVTAGLDDIRGAKGLIRGARSMRVAGFSLRCVGISSHRFIVCVVHLTSADSRAEQLVSLQDDHTVTVSAAKFVGP